MTDNRAMWLKGHNWEMGRVRQEMDAGHNHGTHAASVVSMHGLHSTAQTCSSSHRYESCTAPLRGVARGKWVVAANVPPRRTCQRERLSQDGRRRARSRRGRVDAHAHTKVRVSLKRYSALCRDCLARMIKVIAQSSAVEWARLTRLHAIQSELGISHLGATNSRSAARPGKFSRILPGKMTFTCKK